MNLKSLISSVGVLFRTSLVLKVGQLGYIALMARLLTPEDFGVFAVIASSVMLGGSLITVGLVPSIIQRKSINYKHIESAVFFSLLISLLLLSFFFVGSIYIENYFSQKGLSNLLSIAGTVFPILAVSEIYTGILSRHKQFGDIAQVEIISTVFGSWAVSITLVLMGFGVWGLLYGLLAKELVKLIANLFKSGFLFFPNWHFSYAKELFSFSFIVAFNRLCSQGAREVDVYVIGPVVGPDGLGLYSRAKTLARLGSDMIGKSIQTVMFPAFSKIQNSEEKIQKGYAYTIRLSSAIAAFITGGIALLAEPFILFFLGDQWGGAAPVLQAFSVLVYARIIFMNSHSLVLGLGKKVSVAIYSFLLLIVSTACVFYYKDLSISLIALYLSLSVLGMSVGYFLYSIYLSGISLTRAFLDVLEPLFIVMMTFTAVDVLVLSELHLGSVLNLSVGLLSYLFVLLFCAYLVSLVRRDGVFSLIFDAIHKVLVKK